MANRTAWVSGLGQGLSSWGTLLNGSDLASLASGSTAASSVAAIANGANLDQFMDVSIQMTIASATPSAGAVFSVYIAMLQQDGSTYGSGEISAGSSIARAPALYAAGSCPIQSSVATTLMSAQINRIILPPQSFICYFYNGSGLSLSATAGNCIVKYKTYNQNLNA